MADLFDIVVARKLSGGGGGGGSSDFSTAEMTLVNDTQNVFDILLLPIIFESEEIDGVVGAFFDQLGSQASVTLTVPLYKGCCIWATSLYGEYADYIFTGLGSVIVEEFAITITGDCTITIS